MGLAPDDAFLKGANLNCDIEAIRASFSPEEIAAFERALPPHVAELFRTRHPAASWVSVRDMLALYAECFERLCGRDLGRMRVVGRVSTGRDLKTVHRAFIKILSPSFVIRRASLVWRSSFKNWGDVCVVAETPTSVRFRFATMPGATAELWQMVAGGNDAISEAIRVREPKVVISEGGGAGDDFAVIDITWR